MKVVIMAGGKGTRIASVANDLPKPMIRVLGKPILEWQIENLKVCGLTEIILVVGYLGHVIQKYFGDGKKFGVNITYYVEDHPLGTAGALFKMKLTEDFLLMCGDVMLNIDFNRFIAFHSEKKAWASLMTHPNDHPYDSSLIVTEILPPQVKGGFPLNTHRVVSWMNKEDERHYYKNRVNAGIEIISPDILRETMKDFVPRYKDQPDKIDLDRDVLKKNVNTGKIFAYDTPEYIKDMGTPDRYYAVEEDVKTGKVLARNLRNQQKAVFLDRDGVINKEVKFLNKPEQMELIPGAAEAIKLINESGYLAIVITNQPVIARGEATWEDLHLINNKMETLLGEKHAYINGIYICPHHPDKGFNGERCEYKIDCNCRKPKPGMLLKAAKDWNIDLNHSIMIGDSDRDYKAGINAGVQISIKTKTNSENSLFNVIKETI